MRSEADIVEEWHELAEKFSEASVWHDRRSRLVFECTLEDVRVRVELVPPLDPDASPSSRIRAQYLLGAGPRFRATPSFYGQIALGWLGFRHNLEGDEQFDAEYSVKCIDRAATRRVFRPRAIELALTYRVKLRSDGRIVTAACAAPTPEPGHLELVAELAAADRPAIDAARGLEGARYQAPTGPWDRRSRPRVTVSGPAIARIGFRGRRRVATVAEVNLPRRFDEPVRVRFRKDGSPQGRLPGPLLAGVPLRRAVLASLEIEAEEARVRWPKAEEDPERLEAGLNVLWHVAQSSRGPYR